MIINEARINEVKSINVGNGATAYQYGGKYFIKKNGEKKEITADQFNKLRSGGAEDSSRDNSKDSSSDNSKIDVDNLDYRGKFGFISSEKEDQIKDSLNLVNDKGSVASSAVNTVISSFQPERDRNIWFESSDSGDYDEFDMSFDRGNEKNFDKVKSYIEDLSKSGKATHDENSRYDIYTIKSENTGGTTDICISKDSRRVLIYNNY